MSAREPDLIRDYGESLISMFMDIRDDGHVYYLMGDALQVKINDRPLCLPYDKLLDDEDYEHAAFFHPLCEDALHGQSPMIHFLTRRVLAAVTFRVDQIVSGLFDLIKDPKKQTKIKNSEAIKFLAIAKDMKDTAPKKWETLVSTMIARDGMFTLYLNRNKEIDGEHYDRVCVIDNPIVNDESAGAYLCGVNVHSKDNKELFKKIIGQIFNGVELSYGSNHTVPYYHCLMSAYVAITKRLNKIVKMFAGSIDTPIVGTEWFDSIFVDNFDNYYRMIPDMDLNTGETSMSSRESKSEKSGRDVEGMEKPKSEPERTTREKPRTTGGVSLRDLDRNKDDDDDYDRRDRRRDRREREPESNYERFIRTESGRKRERDDDRDGRRDRRRSNRDRLEDIYGDSRDDRRDRRDRGSRRDRDDRGSRRSGGGVDLSKIR